MGALLASGAASSSSFPLLAAMIVVPFVGAGVIAAIPKSRSDLFRPIAVLTSVTAAAIAIYTATQFRTGDAGFQFVIDRTWIADLGVSLHFGVDGISVFLLVMTAVIFPIALVGARPHVDEKDYFAWMMVLMGGCFGTFVALDMLVFFIFFEVVLVPMYFLIGGWGHGERVYAATKFFLYTMFGSAFLLVGVIALAVLHQRAVGGPLTFDMVTIARDQAISTTAGRWIFVLFAIAFAVKVPLFPLHTWLPDAHTHAPTAGSVNLAAELLKFGTYGYLRFGLFLLPEAAAWAAPVMITLGVVGIIYGAIAAAMQKDLKRIIAYSSIAHLGFVVMGTFSLTVAGITGGLLIMVNHGIITGALFLLVGLIYARRHTYRLDALSGLQKSAPILAAVFMFATFASIGLPGLSGFPGEFLALLGTFTSARWWGVVAAIGVILSALYMLWAFQRVFHGKATGVNATMRDMSMAELVVIAPLLAIILFLGLYPTPLIQRMEPSVKALVAHVAAYSDSDRVDRHDPRDLPDPKAGSPTATPDGSAEETSTAPSGKATEADGAARVGARADAGGGASVKAPQEGGS